MVGAWLLGASLAQWFPAASMSTARYSLGVAALDGRLYAVGGGYPEYLASMEVYDPATQAWEDAPVP